MQLHVLLRLLIASTESYIILTSFIAYIHFPLPLESLTTQSE